MGSFLIELVADADTTMLCDAVMCGDVERGDPIPASQLEGLTLSTVTYSDGTTIDNVDVNSLTTMATDAIFSAVSLNPNLDLADAATFLTLQEDASEVVGAIIGVDLSESNIFAIDIVDASVSADISTTDSIAATLTLINASLSGLDATGSTLEAEITAYLDAVEEVTSAVLAYPDVDLGATNSDALDLVNETQAIISVEVAEIASVVGSEEGGVVLELEEVPTELDEEALSETIGEIISGTGATGGTS